jgi:hypothetical protein
VKVDFTQGAYTARSVTADAQRQINLYAEPGSADSPHKISLYPTPGLQLVADYTGTITGRCRGLHWASNLTLYAVFGVTFVRINTDWTYQLIGTLTGSVDDGYPVSMADNGTTIFIVDGRLNTGWTYGLLSGTFAAVADPAFFGSTRVDYIDTYFIFQHINTQQFYISDSLDVTFNPLWFAGKVGYSDLLVSVAALHDAVWLFGETTTEIWYNSGAADFPFQRMGGGVLQFGCASTYSVVVAGNGVYWMSQDRHGRLMFLRGEGYQAKRVSNFAVEQAWSEYNLNAGAIISMVYQTDGHEFIVIQFTNVGQTWVLDATTEFWHQRQTGGGAWAVGALAFWKSAGFGGVSLTNSVVAGDSAAAKLYTLERSQYTDNGVPITRLRSWPHVLASSQTQLGVRSDGQQRVSHHQFVTAMSGTSLSPDQVSLRWSDDGGQTFGSPVVQTTNNASNGQYSWRRLGMARDRVYELSWTATGETALNGAWVELEPAGT